MAAKAFLPTPPSLVNLTNRLALNRRAGQLVLSGLCGKAQRLAVRICLRDTGHEAVRGRRDRNRSSLSSSRADSGEALCRVEEQLSRGAGRGRAGRGRRINRRRRVTRNNAGDREVFDEQITHRTFHNHGSRNAGERLGRGRNIHHAGETGVDLRQRLEVARLVHNAIGRHDARIDALEIEHPEEPA